MGRFINKEWRNRLVWGGLAISYIGNGFFHIDIPNYFLRLLIILIGIGVSLWGCYIWTQLKNRHPAFMLWGILTPIGLLGISLLKDKSIYYYDNFYPDSYPTINQLPNICPKCYYFLTYSCPYKSEYAISCDFFSLDKPIVKSYTGAVIHHINFSDIMCPYCNKPSVYANYGGEHLAINA